MLIQKEDIQNKYIKILKNLTSGAISGALSRTAVAPIERIIILR